MHNTTSEQNQRNGRTCRQMLMEWSFNDSTPTKYGSEVSTSALLTSTRRKASIRSSSLGKSCGLQQDMVTVLTAYTVQRGVHLCVIDKHTTERVHQTLQLEEILQSAHEERSTVTELEGCHGDTATWGALPEAQPVQRSSKKHAKATPRAIPIRVLTSYSHKIA